MLRLNPPLAYLRKWGAFVSALGLMALVCLPALAQHDARQIAEDAVRHQALAQAMQSLSACYAKTAGREECVVQTQAECVGLAIGKHCGLREEGMNDPVRTYRLLSQAHAVAAQCMVAGKPYEDCLWDLQTACKGLGVGKYCGMVHAHSF